MNGFFQKPCTRRDANASLNGLEGKGRKGKGGYGKREERYILITPHASCLVSWPTGGIYIPSSERFVQSFDFDISSAILFLILF